jgi:predicted nucleic acid-binding protein
VKYLLDSNAIIYHLNDELTNEGDRLFEQVVISGGAYSAITRLEVLGFAMPTRQRLQAQRILHLFQELPIDDSTLQQAIALRSTSRIKSIDALIAATALLHGLPLISRNRKDFAAIEGLSLIDPFQSPALS